MSIIMSHRGGKKKKILDVFGTWHPVFNTVLHDLEHCRLPEPLVDLSNVLDCNFEWTEDGTLPFDVLDQLRNVYHIDVTGLTMSRTPHGNLYRQYVIFRG